MEMMREIAILIILFDFILIWIIVWYDKKFLKEWLEYRKMVMEEDK